MAEAALVGMEKGKFVRRCCYLLLYITIHCGYKSDLQGSGLMICGETGEDEMRSNSVV